MKNMPAGNTGRSIWDVRKTELSFFYELYIELCALQEIAKEKDMTWMFITLTCPPSYHPNPELG
ncbi:replication endonuclease, partial [Vibrio parahaemolyticus]